MAIYKGKNDNSTTKGFFYTRAKYKFEAFDLIGPSLMESVRDFTFTEYALYGKVDHHQLPAIPKQSKLLGFTHHPSQPQPLKMLGFFGHQLHDLFNLINRQITIGALPPNGNFLSDMRPHKAYVDPFGEYDNYIAMFMNTFYTKFVKKRVDKIKTYEDYLNLFVNYCNKMGESWPFTFSAWYKTKYAPPFASGIYADLLNIPLAKDSEKEVIVTDMNFPFFVNACKQFGLLVSKNNPNIVVSDLNSPATKKYLLSMSISGVSQIFKNMYRPVADFDIPLLNQILTDSYDSLIVKKPNITSHVFTRSGHMITNLQRREKISNIEYNKYIKFYIIIRNIEENNYFNKHELKEIMKNVTFFENKLDRTALMKYINKQYLGHTITKPGSGQWYKKYMEDK